jgi:osmoprotectant transport system substrate-binding protein
LQDDAITVASFDFPESLLLAELYALALEGAGVRVERQLGLGPRELVQPALQRGLVELVPEYAGSALGFVTLGEVEPVADTKATHAALTSALAGRGVLVLEAAPAEDANGLAVTEETARRLGLRIVSDLADHAPGLVLGGPPECPQRPLCLPGFRERYRLRFERFLPLDSGGPLTMRALREGVIDVGVVFTSDPVIGRGDVTLLGDDLGLQPAENVTPVVREEVLERFGDAVVEVLNSVSAVLTTDDLRSMNARVSFDGEPYRDVAASWLRERGLAG